MTDFRTSPDSGSLRQVLGAFYKTVDVMKSARNSETKMMSVWADDMKAVEDVMFFLENLRDRPGLAPTPGLWRPIETAPKDGTKLLFCYWEGSEQTELPIASGYWSRLSEGWYADQSGQMIAPTHWMHSPEPPQSPNSSTDRTTPQGEDQ